MTEPPAWLESLVYEVLKCMQAHNVLGPISYRWGGGEKDSWEVMVYPSIGELVGGEEDGTTVAPGFNFDLLAFGAVFDDVTAAHWQSHGFGPHDHAGRHISYEGSYKGHQVCVRILSEAPPDEDPGFKVDWLGSKGIIPGPE